MKVNNGNEQKNNKGTKLDDILKNADKVVESVRHSLKTMTNKDKPDLINPYSTDEINNNIKISNPGVNAFSICKSSLSIQIIQDEIFLDNCSFVSFDFEENLKRLLPLPANISLKGTVTNSVFLDHVDRIIKKINFNYEINEHAMSIGFIDNKNIHAQNLLTKLFTIRKVVPYIKYSMSSKLFILPKN